MQKVKDCCFSGRIEDGPMKGMYIPITRIHLIDRDKNLLVDADSDQVPDKYMDCEILSKIFVYDHEGQNPTTAPSWWTPKHLYTEVMIDIA